MKYLRVRNLDRYQHYKQRNPPWVKLHQTLLENYEFVMLPDAAKAHAICIVLLSSRMGNKLPNDAGWIKGKIGAQSRVDLPLLLGSGFLEEWNEDASESLAVCAQSADSERETEREGETETEKEGAVASDPMAAFDPPFQSERFREALGSWLRHRVEKRKPVRANTEAWKRQREDIVEWGEARSIAAIHHSIAKDYQGLFEPSANGNGSRPSQPQSFARGEMHKVGTLKPVNVIRPVLPVKESA